MTINNPIFEIKENQKKLALKIKEQHDLWDSIKFRHQHIAYCELRGRSRDQIEQPAKYNKPNEEWISKLKKEWGDIIKEWRISNEKK